MKKLLTILASSTLLVSTLSVATIMTNNTNNMNVLINHNKQLSVKNTNEKQDLSKLIESKITDSVLSTSPEDILEKIKTTNNSKIDQSQIYFSNISLTSATIKARSDSKDYTGQVTVTYKLTTDDWQKELWSNLYFVNKWKQNDGNMGIIDPDVPILNEVTDRFWGSYESAFTKQTPITEKNLKIEFVNIDKTNEQNKKNGTAVIKIVDSDKARGAAVVNFSVQTYQDAKYDEQDPTKCTEIGWFLVDYNGTVVIDEFNKETKEVPVQLPEEITSLQHAFRGVENDNIKGIEKWDTKNITDMSFMFENAKKFNGNISIWNINGNISKWDTSNVTNMTGMFLGAQSFNQDINTKEFKNNDMVQSTNNTTVTVNKSTTQVENEENVNAWDTSKVTDMSGMFNGAEKFNQNIGNWNTSNVTNMSAMFMNAKSFNQDISKWDVKKVKSFDNFSIGSKLDKKDLPKFETPTPKAKTNIGAIVGGTLVAIAVVGAVGYFIAKRRKK